LTLSRKNFEDLGEAKVRRKVAQEVETKEQERRRKKESRV